jgi:hypothetical protein
VNHCLRVSMRIDEFKEYRVQSVLLVKF